MIDEKLIDRFGIKFSIDNWFDGFKNLFLDIQNRNFQKKSKKSIFSF